MKKFFSFLLAFILVFFSFTPADAAKAPAKLNPNKLSEAKLGKINLLDSKKTVKKIMGKPKKVKRDMIFDDVEHHYYKGMTVTFLVGYDDWGQEDFVTAIETTSSKYKTKRGLKVGDSKRKVTKLYGKPASTHKEQGYDCLHYSSGEWGYQIKVFLKKGKVKKIWTYFPV